MAGSRTVEVHHGVVQGFAHHLGDHLRQLEVVNLLGADKVELGTLGTGELTLVLVIFGEGEDELETVHDIPDVNVVPGAWDGPGDVRVDGDLSPLHDSAQDARDEFLRVLSLSEDIHGVSHHHRELVSVVVGHGELLAASLASRVGVATVVSVVLSIGDSPGGRPCKPRPSGQHQPGVQLTKHFVCREVDEPIKTRLVLPSKVKDVDGSNNIVHDELHGILDTPERIYIF